MSQLRRGRTHRPGRLVALATGNGLFSFSPQGPAIADVMQRGFTMNGRTILIADDDAFIRDLVRHKLTLLGHRVHLARDGAEAVEQAYQNRPDLIVLDMVMPEMNGLETLCHLKADLDLSAIPVLMLTAMKSESDVRGAIRLGAAGYMTKPFQLEQFSDRVARMLRTVQPATEPARRTSGTLPC